MGLAIDHDAMQLITPPGAHTKPPIAPLLAGTAFGSVLVVCGIVLAWFAFATPLLSRAIPVGRPDVVQTATGMALWAFALVAPAGFVLFGVARLARNLAAVKQSSPRKSAVIRALTALPEDVVVASGITLPDGRGVSDLVVGPFGAAVIRSLPPAAATRIVKGNWQVRGARGWIPLENPLDRATRDAERVRRWLGHDDVDFIVKTYAAVVGVSPTVERTAACAVLTPETVASWVTGLPPQRTLTESRRAQILELVQEAAT